MQAAIISLINYMPAMSPWSLIDVAPLNLCNGPFASHKHVYDIVIYDQIRTLVLPALLTIISNFNFYSWAVIFIG